MPTQQRISLQREIILAELRKAATHLTADELYDRVRRHLPRISLGTVYRNLEQLAEYGEINKIESAGESKRFESDTRLHQHARCQKCGHLVNIMPPVQLPDTRLLFLPDFTVTATHLEFSGLCHACMAQAEK